MLVRFLVLELLFQALSRYSKILVYTCISTIFCSRTVILQLLVVQVVWFLLQFLCLRCIARSAYVVTCYSAFALTVVVQCCAQIDGFFLEKYWKRVDCARFTFRRS